MKSTASNVQEYISEVPADRRATITKLRSLCKKYLAAFEESMDYGMPVYKRNGELVFAFASQKNNISIYGCGATDVKELRAKLATSDKGKGCVRFSNPEKIDFEVVGEILKRIAKRK